MQQMMIEEKIRRQQELDSIGSQIQPDDPEAAEVDDDGSDEEIQQIQDQILNTCKIPGTISTWLIDNYRYIENK